MKCIFCNITTKLHHNVVWEDAYFWLLYDGFPIADPHLLIIPKTHVLCYEQLPQNQFSHVEGIIDLVAQKMIKQLLFFEHGDIGQTVKHAHLHVVPFDKDIPFIINQLGFVGRVETIRRFSDIVKFPQYLLFMKNGEWVIFLSDSGDVITPAPITNALAKYFGKPVPAANRPAPTNEAIERMKNVF